jgi:hypothetical protein
VTLPKKSREKVRRFWSKIKRFFKIWQIEAAGFKLEAVKLVKETEVQK